MTPWLERMNLHRRLFLTLTLTLLLFGLAAHSLSVASLCGCMSAPQDSAANLDLCLVCQLQTGIHTSPSPECPNGDGALYLNNQPALNLLEHTVPILHPPIA